MPITFASGRSILNSSDWTITTSSGGTLTAGTYYFSLQARNRIGYNLPLYSGAVSVSANQKITITINSSAKLAAEDWHYYIIEYSNSSTVSTYIQVAKLAVVNPTDQYTVLTFPLSVQFTSNAQLGFNSSLSLPTTGLINGRLAGLNSSTYIYEYDSYDSTTPVNSTTVLASANGKRWKARGNFSNRITSTTTSGGCNLDIRSFTDTDIASLILPIYGVDGSESIPLKYYISNDVNDVVDAGTRIVLSVFLGELNKSSLFENKIILTPRGHVNTSTYTLRTVLADGLTSMSSIGVPTNYSYSRPNLILEDDLNVGEAYYFELKLDFESSEFAGLLPEGSVISFLPGFTTNTGVYNELGLVVGNIILPEGDKGRVLPDIGLGVKLGSVAGLVAKHSFQLQNSRTIPGLSSNTANQKIVINKNGIGYLASVSVPNDAAIRALVSTVSGESSVGTWSSYVSVANNTQITLTIQHPCTSNGQGYVRNMYPDVIAGSTTSSFNPQGIVIYLQQQSTGEIRKFTGNNITVSTTQNITLSSWSSGTVVAATYINPNTYFSLYAPGATVIASSGTGTFPAGSFRGCFSYTYTGNQVTSVSHSELQLEATGDPYITELNGNLSEVYQLLKYYGNPVSTIADLRAIPVIDLYDNQERFVASIESRYRFVFDSLAVDDGVSVLKPTELASTTTGRWIKIISPSWFVGTVAPSTAEGKDGDFYYNKLVCDLYQKISGSWVVLSNLKGVPPTFTIGTVTTGSPGSNAAVSITGTVLDPVLNLTIPRGANGLNPVLGIGNITALSPGSTPTASVDNTDPLTPLLNLGLVSGNPGSVSSDIGSYLLTGVSSSPVTGVGQFAVFVQNNALRIRTPNNGNTITLSGTSVVALSITAGSVALDCSLSTRYSLVLTENVTSWTVTNVDRTTEFVLEVYQDTTGNRYIDWFSTADWEDRRPVDVSTAANSKTTITFRADSSTPTRLLGVGSTSYGNPTVVDRTYVSDGDTNGVFFYLGTVHNTVSWINPVTNGRVSFSNNSGALVSGSFPLLTDRTTGTVLGSNTVGSWIQVDLRTYELRCNRYSIRNITATTTNLRNWQFQGSKDAITWVTLDAQTNNTTISVASTWYNFNVNNVGFYRYFRIQSTGKDSSGSSDYVALGELELYGKLRIY
jgi:hypothetical protein